MAFDAGMVYAVAHELRESLIGARVEKVQQPEKDEIVLLLHKERETKRLLLSASASSPRIHVTEALKENPLAAPMFCMLLRKHLGGARLSDIVQPGFERVLELVFDVTDEMGFSGRRSLIIEIMGKYSNIIFCDGERRILGACRTVDFTTSQKRQVLPGMQYELPPAQDKKDPMTELSRESFLSLCADTDGGADIDRADKLITSRYLGISSLLAREIALRASSATGGIYSTERLCSCTPERLYEELARVMEELREARITPTLVRDASGKPIEYCFTDISIYDGMSVSHPSTISELLESFFGERDRAERRKQREADILHMLKGVEARLNRKLAAQAAELAACKEGEAFKRYGDLITANIWAISRGMEEAELTDYYSESLETVKVPLDSRLSPSQNAQRYYKRYNKLKTAERELAKQMEVAKGELVYIGTVFDALSRCETEADIDEIRTELAETGFASRMKSGKGPSNKKKLRKARAIEYETSGGYRVLCGRNNLQNDILTMVTAERDDWWFHTKNIPGSHVIMLASGMEEPSAEDFTEAAMIAAHNSGAADGASVAVDYTQVRYVKKPAGSKPGYVIYTKNWTAYVTPDEDAVNKLRRGK